MPIHNLIAENKDYHASKIAALSADSPRRWGQMDSTRMMRHLRGVIEVSLGESAEPVKLLMPPILTRPIGWLFFDVITTWPAARKGTPSLSVFFPPSDLPFEREQQALLDAIDRFADRCSQSPDVRQLHPLFGAISLSRWARIHGVHMNHHYRQFGLV